MLTGISKARKKNGKIYYRAGITYRGKHISLGSFDKAREGHAAYKRACEILKNTDISFESLFVEDCSSPLSFEKSVILFNFRDNGVYIKNPIYLRKREFSYFISPQTELKFDVDDLFYYSMHKIMKRQGRLFVNDYGCQTGILTRYGLSPYAVKDRDYSFENGDSTDFRYSNINIINPYHGVRIERKGADISYSSYLHINGDWKIGNYKTLNEAAIAYNKAVDIAVTCGLDKNYITNYVQELKPKEYADTYAGVEISKKLISYLKSLNCRN